MSNPISELDQIAFELEEWIRQPDWAEKFTLQDMVDWASDKRPIHIVQKLRQISARQGAPELTEGHRLSREELHKQHAADWMRQIINAGGNENIALQAVTLAALNGLFDHIGTDPSQHPSTQPEGDT